MATRTIHTETGYSDEVVGTEILYFVDFGMGTGDGEALLQVNMDGDWWPADVPYTDDMLNVRATDIRHTVGRPYRWKVTVNSGSIVTLLDRN
jgi:hypothetical protein